MPRYRVTAPDGRVLRLTGDRPPTKEALDEIFAATAPQAAPQPRPQPAGPPGPSDVPLSPEQIARLPEGAYRAPGRAGYYRYDRQPGQPEITGHEGFRRAAMTAAPAGFEAAAGDPTAIDVAAKAMRREESKRDILRREEEGLGESGWRDIKEIGKGIGSIVTGGGVEAEPDVATERFGPAPSLLRKNIGGLVPEGAPPLADVLVGEISAWYADLVSDPIETLRYNPVEGALEAMPLISAARKMLTKAGKADEAAALGKVADEAAGKGRLQASKAGFGVRPASPARSEGMLEGVVIGGDAGMDSIRGVSTSTSPRAAHTASTGALEMEAATRWARGREGFRAGELREAMGFADKGSPSYKGASAVGQWIASTGRFTRNADGSWRLIDDIEDIEPTLASRMSAEELADARARLRESPLRGIRHAAIDALFKGEPPFVYISQGLKQSLLAAKQAGYTTKGGAKTVVDDLMNSTRTGTQEEIIGISARLQEAKHELRGLDESRASVVGDGAEVPRELQAAFNDTGLEIVELAEALYETASRSGARLQLQKLRLQEFSDLENLVHRATAQKGSKLSPEEVSELMRRSEGAAEIQKNIDKALLDAAKRMGVDVRRMHIDPSGIPEMASGLEVDKLQDLYGKLEQHNQRTSRLLNQMRPGRKGVSGWLKNHSMAMATLPKMIMAGWDLSAPLRQGIWGHIIAPSFQIAGWKAMIKAAKPTWAGKVEHPFRKGVMINADEFADISNRQATTGMYEGISHAEAARQREMNLLIRDMKVEFTGTGSVSDPSIRIGTRKGGGIGLRRREEQFMSNTVGGFEAILEAELAGEKGLLARKGLGAAKFAAKYAKKYGNFSERTFALGLNHMRRNAVVRLLGLDGMTAKEIAALRKAHNVRDAKGLPAIGDMINITHGRGNMLDLEKATVWNNAANALMFSPRFVMSRFQNLFLPVLSGRGGKLHSPLGKKLVSDRKGLMRLIAEGGAKALPFKGEKLEKFLMSKRGMDYLADADDLILKESLAAATRIAGMVSLANLAGQAFFDDELFANSPTAGSDWLKLKLPGSDTRLDIFGGLQGPLRFLHTLGTGKRYNLSGDEQVLDQDFGSTSYNEVGRFMRQKLSPLGSVAFDLHTGKDFKGDEATAWTVTKDAMLPIILQDMGEAGFSPVSDNAFDLESLAVLPAIFGVGYTRFKPKGSID